MNPREHADCSYRNDDECDEDGKQTFPCLYFLILMLIMADVVRARRSERVVVKIPLDKAQYCLLSFNFLILSCLSRHRYIVKH